jgi:DNA recombination protein RmuC
VFLPGEKAKYFCGKGWTGESTECLSGKSVPFTSPRLRERLIRSRGESLIATRSLGLDAQRNLKHPIVGDAQMDQLYIVSAAAVFSLLAAIFALFAFARINRYAASPPLTSEILGAQLRNESDILRRIVEDTSRVARQELLQTLRDFQTTNLHASKTLNDINAQQLESFGGRLEKGIETIDKHIEAIGQKLNDDLRLSGVEATTNRDALRLLVEGKLGEAISKQSTQALELRQALENSFQGLQIRVRDSLLEASNHQKERLDGNTVALTELTLKQETAHERLRLGVESRLEAMRQENATKLDEMRQTVDEKLQATLDTRLGESFSRVVEQLKIMHQGIGEMRELAANVGDLQKVLTNVKVRGTYGEVQLEFLLEEFLSPEQYIKNASVKDESSERVEFAVRLPGKQQGGEILLPIDAKFPREDYERLIEATEAGSTELIPALRKQLENRIKSSAKDIRDKYINPPRTTDFGILFIPTESLYAEVLRQPGLLEILQRDYRVTLASPTTLAALLNALQMGFRSLAIEKRSSEVWQVLAAVRTEFGKYNQVVEKLGKQLGTATNAVDSLRTRTRVMTRTLKTIEVLPDHSAAETILGLTPDELLNEPESDEVEDGVEALVGTETGISLPN